MNQAPLPSEWPPLRWHQKLNVRFALVQLYIMLLIVGATLLIYYYVDRAQLRERGNHAAEDVGRRIADELGERITQTERLTADLARLAERLPPEPDQIKRIVPHLLDFEGSAKFIAGGGVWPEPRAFDPQRERDSYFWGRDDFGALQFYDNYNEPSGPGYHNEEWYVPARFTEPGQGFWSKSYLDPYSHQPMVTCTVAMRKQGQFNGVATVDLRLEGLDAFFQQAASAVGGYVFALDRNNKFLSFPRPHMVRVETESDAGELRVDLLYLRDLAKTQPVYQSIVAALAQMDEKHIQTAVESGHFRGELVDEIAAGSYQINKDEARRIVASLSEVNEHQLAGRVTWTQDPILGGPATATIFHMPRTHWSVVIVTPDAWIFDSAESTAYKVAFSIVAIEFIGLLILFLILYRKVVGPIRAMVGKIGTLDANDPSELHLDETPRNELGALAYTMNRHNRHLHRQLLKYKQSNGEIERDAIIAHLDRYPWPAAILDPHGATRHANPPFRRSFETEKAMSDLIAAVKELKDAPAHASKLLPIDIEGEVYPFHLVCFPLKASAFDQDLGILALDIGEDLESEAMRRSRQHPPAAPGPVTPAPEITGERRKRDH